MLTTNTNHPGIIYFFVDVLILESTYKTNVYVSVSVYMYMYVVQGAAVLPQCGLGPDNSLTQREGRAKPGTGRPQPVFPFRASDTDARQNRRGRVGSGTNVVVLSLLAGYPGATSIP